MSDKNFGIFVSTARDQLGLKQNELSREVGITSSYLSDIEHGKRPSVSNDLIRKLSSKLSVSEDYLYFLIGKIPPNDQVDIDQCVFLEAIEAFRSVVEKHQRNEVQNGKLQRDIHS